MYLTLFLFTGFDFYDFSCVHENKVIETCKNKKEDCDLLLKYLHESARIEKDWKGYYEENDVQKSRVVERS